MSQANTALRKTSFPKEGTRSQYKQCLLQLFFYTFNLTEQKHDEVSYFNLTVSVLSEHFKQIKLLQTL